MSVLVGADGLEPPTFAL